MEMCYDGTLVMPSSYAVMSEDEMTYVEGGGAYKFQMSRDTAAKWIDVAAIVILAGLSASATVGQIASKIGWTTLRSKAESSIIKLGVSLAAAKVALDILVTVLDFSIGNALAWVLDKTDASGLNGMIQYGFSGGHLGGGGSF